MSDQRRIFSVSELNLNARRALETGLGEVWVSGELSRVTLHSSGHWYFTLKDSNASVSCAMFSKQNVEVNFIPKEGVKVELLGLVSLYESSGRYQIIVSKMDEAGKGDLYKKFELLKSKLDEEGLFDATRKKVLPKLPQRIGLVTSPTGAAVRDIVEVLTRRFPNLEILLAPVTVQGEGSAQSIVTAIEYMNQIDGLDILIVGRGGGSIEDLWSFNEEIVARSIAASNLPIISAVGHEIDFTIADFVADVRAPTPSAAAELAVPEESELRLILENHMQRLIHSLRDVVKSLEVRYARVVDHPVFHEPRQAIELYKRSINQYEQKLGNLLFDAQRDQNERVNQAKIRSKYAAERALQQMQQRVDESGLKLRHGCEVQRRERRNKMEQYKKQLFLLNPLAVLGRGYSITTQSDGSVIRSIADIKLGEALTTQLDNGKILSKVVDLKDQIGENDG